MGRPQFSQSGTDGGGQTVAVQDRPSPTEINVDQTSTVAAGTKEDIEIYAPSGSVYHVKTAYIDVPSPGGDGTNNHRVQFRNGQNGLVAEGKSDDATQVRFFNSRWEVANIEEAPGTDTAQLQSIQSLTATDSSPLILRYSNGSTVDQTNSRTFRVYVNEVTF